MISTLLMAAAFAAPVAQDAARALQDSSTVAPPDVDPIEVSIEAPVVGASFTYLRGFTWEDGPAARDVVTVETVARSGSTELFVMTEARHLTTREALDEGAGTFAYIEGHLRWRIGRVVGYDPLVIAHELNTGGGRLAHLHGIGWVRPVGNGAIRAHVYLRDDLDASGISPQLLLAGAARTTVAGVPIRLAGYGDFVGPEGHREGLFYGELQILVETGDAGGMALGVELHHSRALGGGARPDEWVPQLAVQWAF